MAYPEPSNVAPWYLRNITQALALNETTGNVYVRTDTSLGNTTITGNVNIPGEIDAHITSVGTSGNITTPYLPVGGNVTVFQGTTPWSVSGNVTVDSITGGNVNVAITSGNVGIDGNVTVQGNVGVTGNVGIIGNVNVTQGTSPWAVSGNVGILGTPNVAITSGNVGIDGNVTVQGNVGILGTPNVAITSGNVGIDGNIDGITANVTVVDGGGSITVDGNVGVTGTVNANVTGGNITVAGNIGVTSFGNISITGNTLPVSGNVGILGTPNVAITSGNVGIDGNVTVDGNVGILGNISGITANVTVVDGGGSITVDGNVGILGNVNVTQGTTPWSVTGNVAVTGSANVALGGTNLDAFGRLRVSNPVTLFDSQNMYQDGGQFSNVTANGASLTYVAAESSFNLSVTSANGSSVINQCKFTQPYQPGKSMLILTTFAFATQISGCRQRVGYFTENNGVYFESDGGDLYLVIRSKASGSIVEERILQANWNGDSLTGVGGATNPSNIELNPELVQIFWCDIEWLGVGNVRAGFVINGQFIVCHTFEHANMPGNTKVYMTSATLNPRYEITNTTATSGSRTMKQICSTVISEGGYTPSPSISYVSSGIQPTRISTANVYTNLASIRLNPNCIDAVVIPSQIDLLLTDVQYGAWQLVVGASNVAGLTYANVNGGVVQANTSPVQIGDGTVVYAGVTSSRDTFTVGDDVAKRLQLGRYANGTPITLTLCAGYGQNNADLIWKFGWSEVTS